MKTLQIFSLEYLAACKKMKPDQIAQFLEDFRQLQGRSTPGKSRLISLKVPMALLDSFKAKAQLRGVRYQTQIKTLMENWLKG
jgi:predicted DNA binding CopG/RHH family protein